MIHPIVRAAIFALAFAGSAATAATARTPYDGAWTVLIVTEKGSCDRAYRYGVRIVDGNVVYDGGVANFSGRVAANGAVRVIVSAGSSRANGAGKLSRNVGTGTWIGQSGNDSCSGYWQAERRTD
jgi:hypothetical protein